ncbi:MAG: tyrosine-type recombinase/integrase [Planctomycetaceae bacterium]|nr:tyrosine-type recombinase/integrase [Planctomycetaceae bacterium]
MAAKSIKSATSLKPYRDFPLTPHRGAKQWCKKHRGKTYYFGPLDDWQKAKARFDHEWPFVIEGRTPPPMGVGEGCTIRDLCNAFIVHKQNRMDGGELSPHSYAEYFRTCEKLIAYFGATRRVDDLRPDDFEAFRKSLAIGCNVVTLGSKINRCRVLFKYAFDNHLIDRPVAYGKAFDRPAAKAIRKARNEAGERMLEADELRRIIAAATQPLRAMILLGVNCGFGNTDVATLPQSAVDLQAAWVTFPRPKTEVPRRCPLWPETVEAIREAVVKRPRERDPEDADLCFLTTRRTRFVRVRPSKRTKDRHVTINAIARRFELLLEAQGVTGRRGVGFYALRHVFETVGGGCRDQVAVNAIMGHVDHSMAAVYRERIDDERLHAVVNHVRTWLWPEGGAA